ncbi:MAG: hypothetical protein KKF74_05355 [Nanoarchaeota archaeon]|nr:hypothetical protein [Nanoarchaeota archaeon]
MKDIKLKLIAISCIFLILGMPVYTAKVFAQDEEQVIEDKTPPSINIEKPPEKVSESFLDIKGTTNEPVVIEVTLNSNYYGTASSTEDNSISIGITLAEGANKIKINSTDAGGNSVIKEFDVFCDSEQPQIIYNNIYELSPAYTAEQTVKGQVNKPNINIDVFVNDKNKYSGKSDSEGNFEIDIKLDKNIKIGVTDKTITVGTEEGNAWENKIKIVATDDYGRNSTIEDVITYTLCGYGSDWDVKTGKITPDVVIPEHLIQGIAQFSFPINLTYRGRSDSSEVALTSEPQLTSYGLSLSSMEEYQEELFAGSATSYWNDDYTIGYFIVNLNSWTKSKEELNNHSFIKIPVRLDVYYEYEDVNGDTVENTQRNCWTISMMVDKEIPLDKIPKKLLNSTVNLLNSTINLIDAIKKPVDTVKKYTFVGCAASWALYFVKSLSVEFSCVSVKPDAIRALIDGKDTCVSAQEVGDCDACLQSLKSLRETEKIRNWLCDRIFCPAVPSLDYHKESYKDSITDVNLCKGVTDEKYSNFFNGRFGPDSDECEEEYKFAWDSAFMTLDEWERANAKEGEVKESFFDKISEGLAFCEKAKEQEIDVVTIGSGNKQVVYLVYPDGSVCIGQSSTTAKGTETSEGVSVGEGESQTFYSCEDEKKLIINEEGVYDVNGKEVKIPPEVQSKRGVEGTDNYILDPTSDIIRSVQAVCLPAISGYLNLWKQILEAVKQCFETIMITGEGSAGVCKAVLTTYVCDMIYDVIRCTGESFTLGADDKVSGGIVGVMQKISTAGTNVLSSVEGRYGQTGMYNTMFNERKLIHSACLFAFTGDWGEFDLDTLLTAEVGMPTLGSEGFLYPTTRRFMGSNPLDYGRTTYIYHIGAGIIAGADLNYRVYLQCSNDNSCTGGRCDCFYRGKEEIYNVASGSLSAGDMFSGEFFEKIVDSSVRYDKAVIEWDWTDNNGQMQTTTKVQNIKEVGEKTPNDCKLDSKSGEFRCKYIIGQYGDARLIDVEGEDKYTINDKTSFDVKLEIIPPESGYDIPKYLIWKIKDSKNIMVDSGQIRVLTKKGTIYEENIAEFDIRGYFTGKTEDTIKAKQYNGNKKLDVKEELIGTPYGSASFLVIFTDVNIEEEIYVYDIYSLTEEGEKGKLIEPFKLDKDLKIITYGSKNIKFRLNSLPNVGDAAIIIVEKGRDSHECDEDGEEDWKVIFELLHSKKKDADLDGDNPQDYECCGSKIDSKEVKITIDCGVEQKDEENNCEKNKLINEECKCDGKTCGNVGAADQWNICCEIGSEVYCSELIDVSGNFKLDYTKISDQEIIDLEYLGELCELSDGT